jgi:hypothetical protein
MRRNMAMSSAALTEKRDHFDAACLRYISGTSNDWSIDWKAAAARSRVGLLADNRDRAPEAATKQCFGRAATGLVRTWDHDVFDSLRQVRFAPARSRVLPSGRQFNRALFFRLRL